MILTSCSFSLAALKILQLSSIPRRAGLTRNLPLNDPIYPQYAWRHGNPAVDQIALRAGERQFTTTRGTLVNGSNFFASMFSGRWDDGRQNSSRFVDADGKLFEHILRYLRHGVLPVFYDTSKGHDHALYFAFLEEAKLFQVDELVDWLEKRHFNRALKIEQTAVVVNGTEELRETRSTELDSEIYPAWKTKKVYVCPRGISVHRGDPQACGRACQRAQGDADDIYDKEHVLQIVVLKKLVVFDSQVWLGGP